jgi:hydroxymethylpyrimidine/phosphomethylpyrimidine kinase
MVQKGTTTVIAKVLTIAGSDSSGGAGIQADLKTFMAFGAYGMSVVTALTAQNTQGVTAIHNAPPDFVRAQIDAVLSDVGADAIKTGMLSSAEIVNVVVDALRESECKAPLIVDPVMVAKSGDRLLQESAIEAVTKILLPAATVITPNAEEAALLTGMKIDTPEEAERAAKILLDMGPKAVLLKGGHMSGGACDDLFIDSDTLEWLRGERLEQKHTHGTGCTLSAAITACMGKGMSALDACKEAKRYITGAIRAAFPVGKGIGPVNHLWEFPDK